MKQKPEKQDISKIIFQNDFIFTKWLNRIE